MKKIAQAIMLPCILLVLFACTKVDGDGTGIFISEGSRVPTDTAYFNPVWDFDLTDASVFLSSGPFYAMGNEAQWADGITYVVPVLTSTNLMNWRLVSQGHAFIEKPNWEEGTISSVTGLFSRSLNTYFLFYKLGSSNMGAAWAATPQGPYRDLGQFLSPDSLGVSSISSPSVLAFGSRFYLFFTAQNDGVYGVQITVSRTEKPATIGQKFKIAGPNLAGALVWRKYDYYYLFGTTNGQIVLARSISPDGPFLNANGDNILSANPTTLITASSDFSEISHIAGVQTDGSGTDWVLYNAIDSSKPQLTTGGSRQVLMLNAIKWNAQDWPAQEIVARRGYVSPRFSI